MLRCEKCGAEIEIRHIYCWSCGAYFKEDQSELHECKNPNQQDYFVLPRIDYMPQEPFLTSLEDACTIDACQEDTCKIEERIPFDVEPNKEIHYYLNSDDPILELSSMDETTFLYKKEEEIPRISLSYTREKIESQSVKLVDYYNNKDNIFYYTCESDSDDSKVLLYPIVSYCYHDEQELKNILRNIKVYDPEREGHKKLLFFGSAILLAILMVSSFIILISDYVLI